MAMQKAYSGRCPNCGSYNSRRCTEIINYGEPAARHDTPPVVSRTRIFSCNDCQHTWSETIGGKDSQ